MQPVQVQSAVKVEAIQHLFDFGLFNLGQSDRDLVMRPNSPDSTMLL